MHILTGIKSANLSLVSLVSPITCPYPCQNTRKVQMVPMKAEVQYSFQVLGVPSAVTQYASCW